jgi:hypothetical protein
MIEGPIKEPSYYYPGTPIQEFLRALPATGCFENQLLPPLERKIAILTHDDQFDPQMFEVEQSGGIESTWFLLTREMDREVPVEADVHLHFDKESATLQEQIMDFRTRFGRSPRFNRVHRLLWRANNFDYPFLAMHGICGDSTTIGTRPFRPTLQGKVLPLWEIPFCMTDRTERFMASYSVAANHEIPFKRGLSPIVILSHPFAVCDCYQLDSCFYEAIHLIKQYGYEPMNMSRFCDQILKAAVVSEDGALRPSEDIDHSLRETKPGQGNERGEFEWGPK